MKRRNLNKRKRSRKQRRPLRFESLEARQMLAVAPWTIDLGGSNSGLGGADLFSDGAGGMLQGEFQSGGPGMGGTVMTTNQPGQNNSPPTAIDDTPASANAPQVSANDGPVDITATLLANDSDADAGDTFALSGVSNLAGLTGEVTFEATSGRVLYNPNGQFISLPDGAIGTDTFDYSITDQQGGAGTATVVVQVTGENDSPVINGLATVSVNQGKTATNTGTLFDPDSGDSVQLFASVGTVTDNGNGTWNWFFDTLEDSTQSQQVKITATDSHGAQSSMDFALTVNYFTPYLTVDKTRIELDEGQTATNTGTFPEPGPDGLTLSASAGSLSHTNDGRWSWSGRTSDGPAQSQTITITARYGSGGTTSTSFHLVVNNVAPSVSVDNAVVEVDEGQTATNSGTFSEPGSDTLASYASAGSLSGNSDGTWNWSADTSDGPAQSQTVTITFTDSDGVATSTTFDLIVNNVAPSVSVDNAVVEVDEGQTATNSGTFSEPGSDTLTLSASAGSLSGNSDGTWNWSAETSDGPAQSQTVTITFTDSDGVATSTTFDLIVNNVAPSVSVDNAVVEVDEGQTATNSGTFSEPGSDTLTLSASAGSLSASSDGTWNWSADTSDGPAQSQTVTITFTDSDGVATSTTFDLIVNNVAPSVSVDNAVVEVDEGQMATNSGTFSEPGSDTLTLSASAGSLSASSDGTWNWSADTSDGPAQSQTVTITFTDSDGLATSTTFDLLVNNVAPSVSVDSAVVDVNEGQTATNTGTFSDPGTDAVTLGASVGAVVDNGDGTWSWSSATSDGPAQQQVTITATDSDGAQSSVSFDLIVNNVAPIAADHSFDATGNVPIEVALSELLTGATDPGDDTITFDSVESPSAMGGSVTVDDENSTFVYMPPAGFEGTDTFQYAIADEDGAVSSGTVSIDVEDMIWFVDSSADPGGDGTLNRPFNALNPLNSAHPDVDSDLDDPGDVIFIATGEVAADGSSYDVSHGGETVLNDHFTSGANANGTPAGWQAGGTGSFATSESTTTITDGGDGPAIVASENTFDPTGKFTTIVASIDSITEGGTARVGIANASLTDQFIVDVQRVSSSQAEILVYGVNGDGVSSTTLTDTFAYSGGKTILEVSFDDDSFRLTAGGFDSGEMQFESAFDTFRLSDLGTTVSTLIGSVSEGDPSEVVFDRMIVGPHDIGFVMEEGQIVVGAGTGADGESLEDYLENLPGDRAFTLATNSQPLPSFSGTPPLIINSTGDVFHLADNNYFDGLSTNAQGSANFMGENIDGLQIFSVVIITSGGGDNNEGVNITGATGTLTISDVQIGGSDAENNGTGIVITGGTATFEFEGVDISQLGGSLIQIVGTDGSTITFDESSSLNLAGSDGVAVQITGNSDGTIALQMPQENLQLNGEGNDFDLSGNEGTETSTPVNDAPFFTIDDVTVQQDGPLGTEIMIANFATGIAVGPQDEIDEQSISGFTLTVESNPDLFAAGGTPTISNDGTLTFTPVAGADGSALIKAQLQDDGGTDNGGADTAVDTFVISIPVNDPPSFTIAADPATVSEDSGEQTVAGFASSISVGPDDESDQSILGFHVTGNTNPSLFAAGPAIDNDGNLTYTPASDAHGTATITVDLQDDGGTANAGDDTSDSQTFDITISPVNDAPTIAAPASANVTEDIATAISGISVDDIDATQLTVTLSVESGSLHVSDSVDGGLAAGGISNNDSATVTLAGTVGQINSTLSDAGGLAFTTAQDLTVDVTLSINVNDNGQSGDDPGDTGGPADEQADATVTLNVTPVNDPPTLGAIGDRTIDEQAELTFATAATDPDHAANDLTFSLDSGMPAAASIDSTTGVFFWTPSETDGPGQFDVTVRVTDDDGLSDTETITITVNEVNRSPVLGAIGSQSVDEQTELSFSATASDPDLPANDLIFSLGAGAPAGATIDAATGVFSWTPGEADGPGDFDVTIVVTDEDSASDSETITISVGDVNSAPTLDAIGDKTVDEGNELTFTAVATDMDSPVNGLAFSLADGASGTVPAGATIDSETGEFSWTPTAAQAGNDFTFDIVVTDNGTPQLSDSETLTITVNEVVLPTIADIKFEIGQGDIAGETMYFSYFVLDAIGPDSGSQSQLELKRVNDAVFTQPELDGGIQQIGFVYDTLGGFLTAHNGVHEFGIDNDGDGTSDDTFTVNVNLAGFTADSFPDYTNITSPGGTIDDTTPTITWDPIAGAASLYVSANAVNGPGIENLEELWSTEPELPGGATSATTAELPTGQPLLATVQANFLRNDLASPSSGDGEVNLSFFSNSIATSEFEISAPVANEAPILDVIGNRSVDEGELLSFTASATDVNGDGLTFSLNNEPAGASIDNSGQFTWTPSDQQVGSFTFDVVVTDNGQPPLSDSESVTLTVQDVAEPNGDELFTLSILDFSRAELDGQTVTFGYLEFEVHGEPVSEDTIIYAQAPGSGTFDAIGDGWGWGEIEFEQGDGQLFEDFIAPFNGDWTLLVDFNDNFAEQGQEADDGVYHISFDLSNVDEATFFPQATAVDSVTPDVAEPRRATIEWTQNSEADFMLAIASLGDNPVDGVEVFEADVPADQTSVTTSYLPAGSVMTAILGAGFDAGDLAMQQQQDADLLDELGVFATTFRTLGFTTAPLVTQSVPTGDTSGDYAGGSDTTGGVDFSFSGVNGPAELSSEFFTTNEHEFLSVLFGGEQAVQELYATVPITGDTLQVWDFNMEDAGGPVGFSSATITVGYDENLFGFEGFDATPADIEQHLDVFHLTPSGDWEVVGTEHDPIANTITFQTDSFSPFVLGQNFDNQGGNQTPVLDPINDETVEVGEQVDFTASATDPDPGQSLTFSLAGNAPAGATIDPNNGQFSWTPTDQQVGSHTFTVQVTDDGQPQESDNETIMVTVENTSEPLLTSSFLDINRIELGDDAFYEGYFEFEVYGDQVTQDTTIYAQAPGSNTFDQIGGGWGFGEVEFEQGDGESFANFIAPIHGSWSFLVDFDNNFQQQGQQADDGLFNIDIDVSLLDEDDFLAAAVINSPVDGETLAAGQRQVTVEWDEHTQADSMLVGAIVEEGPDVFEFEVPTTQTSVTSPLLPSDVDMLAYVGASSDLGFLATQDLLDAQELDELGFALTTFTGVFFSTAPLETADAPAGSYAGGAAVIGGVDYSFTGLSGPAAFSSEYFATNEYDLLSFLLGGDQATQQMYDTVAISGDVLQIWDLNQDAGFTSATVTVGYDESLLVFDGYNATPADIEQYLGVFHPDPVTGEWMSLTIINHDTLANTITFEADSFSPFVLGQDFGEDPFAAVEIELSQLNQAGEDPYFMFLVDLEVDHEATNPNTKLLFAAPDEPGNFQQLMGGPIAGYVDIVQEDDETAAEFFDTFSGDWGFRIDFAGDGFSEGQGDEEITINLDLDGILAAFPEAPVITNPTAGGNISVGDGTPSIQWNPLDQNETDFVIAVVDVVAGDELIDDDLPASATSVDLVGAQADTQIEAQIGAIQIDDNGNWGSVTAGAAEFEFWLGNYATFTADVVDGSVIAEVELEVFQAMFEGELILGADLELMVDDPRTQQATEIKVKGPGDAQHRVLVGGWGWDSTSYDAEPGQSIDSFLDSLDGEYEVLIDFEGDSIDDAYFTFEIDSESLTSTDFAAAPTITSPGSGETLPSNDRTVTIAWNQVAGADLIAVDTSAVEPDGIPVEPTMFDLQVDGSTTSVETGLLPTGVDYFLAVGSIVQPAGAVVQTAGTHTADISFSLAHFAPSSFSIAATSQSVPAGDSSGTFAGVGGTGPIQYDLTGVAAGGGNFLVEYQPIAGNQEIMATMFGSEQAVQDSFDVHYPTGETNQGWRIRLTDGAGDPVAATGMELELAYDDSLIEWGEEQNIQAFQWDEANQQWHEVTITSQDTVNNTITVETDLIANIVLGYSVNPLHVAAEPAGDVEHPALQQDELAPIVDEAIDRLAATGLTASQLSTVETIGIQIADLPDGMLGMATAAGIIIDDDAAGHGWFVDPTPDDDLEFHRPVAATERQAISGKAVGQVDLLTVLMHEMGHIVGEAHDHDDSHGLMSEELPQGTRRFPEWHEFDGIDNDLLDLLAHDLADAS